MQGRVILCRGGLKYAGGWYNMEGRVIAYRKGA